MHSAEMSWLILYWALFICLLHPLAIQCAIQSDKFSRVELTVLSPLNRSTIGGYVEVRFQLDFYDDSGLRVNPAHNEYVLEIADNNDIDRKSILPSFAPWLSIGYGPIVGSGPRRLDFKITVTERNADSVPQKHVLTANVIVNVISQSFERMPLPSASSVVDRRNHEVAENDRQVLNDILSSMNSFHKELAITAAFAFDNRNASYETLVKISPQIMEFFDWSGYATDCKESPVLNFGPLFTSWQNVRKNSDVQYRAYYDVSVALFTSSASTLDAQQLIDMTRFVYAMKLRTSGHLVLITTEKLMIALIGSADSLFGTSTFLTEGIEQQFAYEDRVVLIYYRSVMKRLLTSVVDYDDFLPAVAQTEVSTSGVAAVGSAGAAATAASRSPQDMITSLGSSYHETENGLNYVILRNSCIQREGKLIVLTPEDYDGPVVDHLNLAELNQFMDRTGFMPFTRVKQGVAYGGDDILFVNASAAVVIPFYHNNVFHHFQSLAGLLSIQDVFPDELKFLLMPKYDSTAENQYEWSNGVLSLVTQFYERELKKNRPDSEGMSVMFQPLFEALFDTTKTEVVCFKNIVAVGQVDTNRGFFTNSSMLNKFREVAYDTYARDNKKRCGQVDMKPEPATTTAVTLTSDMLTPRDSNSPQFHRNNKYLIRVTFSLRLHNRRILNLSALHKALIDSGAVDMDWLNHLKQNPPAEDREGEAVFNIHSGWTYLDNMSLQDQIKIFKETDLFIGVHGSAFINAALFMQPNSVCIALMQSRHIEFVLPQIIHQAGIVFHFLPIMDQNQSTNCLGTFPPDCLSGSLTRAGRMDCLAIRNCDVSVDADWFQALVQLSAYHIRANKRADKWDL